MSDDLAVRHVVLYGRTPLWALITVPDNGWMIPPTFGDLPLLGAVYDVFTMICRRRPQAEIAAHFGVSQQTISRYVNAQAVPLFSDREWVRLVQLYEMVRGDGW